jgi:predicted DNA-binding transcriptional regulator YafY
MPKQKPTVLQSRPPLARMLHIHEELKQERLPNATGLSDQHEVTPKTIHRDIAYMRDQLGLPIQWIAKDNGYRYTSHVDAFPIVQISEGELFALLVAQKALEPYTGTPFQAPLQSALKKLSEGLKDKVFISLDGLDTPLSFKSAGISNADLDTFQLVTRAVEQQQELHFAYKKLGASDYEQRRSEPLHLCCVENQWYVICHDLQRDALRTFALVRMRHLQLAGKYFKRPEDFDIQNHLKDAFGVFVGAQKHEVRVHFNSWAAQLIQEKNWHPAQELRALEDGGLEFRIELADLFEIERWILSWGRHATVLGPAELKQRIRTHAEAILANS